MPIVEPTSEHLAELVQTLSDPSRLRIISALIEAEMNVTTLAGCIGMSESAVSHQLRGLRQMHLVRVRKAGREVFYSLEDEHVAALFHQGLDHSRHD